LARPRVPLLQRIPTLVTGTDPRLCWTWKGALSGFLPIVKLDGRIRSARRVIYEAYVRDLLPTEKVRPMCQNPVCVSPHHVEVYEVGYDKPEIGVKEEAIAEPETTLSVDELADIIIGMSTRDPGEIAKTLGTSLEAVHAALAEI
jgi:hypothetical protein